MGELASCVNIRKIDTYPKQPVLPFCGCEDALFAKEFPGQAPVVKLPTKPDPRAPIFGRISLTNSASPLWSNEGKGWATTKVPPSPVDLANSAQVASSSLQSAPFWAEEREGWATTKKPLSPLPPQRPFTKSTPLWPEEGQGWATTKEPLFPLHK